MTWWFIGEFSGVKFSRGFQGQKSPWVWTKNAGLILACAFSRQFLKKNTTKKAPKCYLIVVLSSVKKSRRFPGGCALRAVLAHEPAGEYQRVHAAALARQCGEFGWHKSGRVRASASPGFSGFAQARCRKIGPFTRCRSRERGGWAA